MSDTELEQLERETQELKDRLAQLEQRKQSVREEIERNKPSQVIVASFVPTDYTVRVRLTKYREDVINVFRSIPGRYFDGSVEENRIPLKHWPDLLEKLSKFEGLDIVYTDGVKEIIKVEMESPDYQVAMVNNKLTIKFKKAANAGLVSTIPGAKWDQINNMYTLPLNEGWRLWESLKDSNVIWEEIAKESVLKEISIRSELDSIALAEDVELNITFADPEFKLRNFQKVTVKFVDAAGGKAIIAHQMGLGKTACNIAYSIYKNYRMAIICPAGLKENWRREIIRLTGKQPYVFSGTEPGIRDVQRLLMDKPQYAIFNYDMVARPKEQFDIIKDKQGHEYKANVKKRWLWIDLINSAGFDVVSFDEAHYLKNTDSNRSIASRQVTVSRVLFNTGTPVLNRPGELWPMLTMINPEHFPTEQGFIYRYTYDGKSARNVEELRELLKPIMIRKLKKDVVKELPPIQRIFEWHELSEKAQKVYNKVLTGIYIDMLKWEPETKEGQQAVPNLLAQITRLKQVCAIDKMDRCAELAVELYDTHENGGPSKVIVFSQFKAVASGIAKRLGNEAVCITGDLQRDERQILVDKFQTDPNVKFACCTWQVAGEGINLTAAGYVIFSDLFWTPANHMQSEERCYGRLNDMHGATSYYMVAKCADDSDSVEVWIQEILARKLATINQVVEGIDTERDVSVANELLKKMKQEMFKIKKG